MLSFMYRRIALCCGLLGLVALGSLALPLAAREKQVIISPDAKLEEIFDENAADDILMNVRF